LAYYRILQSSSQITTALQNTKQLQLPDFLFVKNLAFKTINTSINIKKLPKLTALYEYAIQIMNLIF